MTPDSRPPVWSTVPGLLTGLAAVITAATGLYLAARSGGRATPSTATLETARAHKPAHDSSAARDTMLPMRFVRQGSFALNPPTEIVMRTEGFRLTDSLGFLRLTDAAFGTGDASASRAPDIFRFELTLTNTGGEPLQLDLTDRFFILEDDRGRRAELRYFCCIARGELLAPGQSRRVLLFFRSTEWYGKEVNAHAIYLKVEGLLPIERAVWRFPTLATAA
jgi:hypothetical protein